MRGGKPQRAQQRETSRKPPRRREPRAQPAPKPSWEPPGLREALPHILPIVVVLLIVYAATAPRTVVLEDDGEFITAVHFLGVPHPPGFPLFVLLAKPFTWLPVGSIAFRVHLASSFFAASCCGLVWWVARTLLGSAGVACLVALSLGFSDAFWSQALIADVYSLNAALFFLLLCLSLAYVHAPSTSRLGSIALTAGLGLSNHWPLLLLAMPGLLPILWPARASIGRDLLRRPHRVVLPLAIGLLPYAWLVVRSRAAPELGFYGSLQNWNEFWHYVSRAGYAHVESDPASGPWDRVQFAAFLLRQCIAQYTPLGAAAAGAGVVMQWRRWERSAALGLTIAFLGGTAALALMVGFPYEYFTRAVFRPYPLIAYGVLSLWLGLGLTEIGRRVGLRNRRLAPLAWLLPGLAIASLTFQRGLARNDRHADAYSSDYARTLLATLAPDATVFSYGDVETFTVGYYHFVEGIRPDVRFLNMQGLGAALDGRLFDPRQVSRDDTIRRATEDARETDRPVYFIGLAPFALADIDYGFYNQVDRTKEGVTSFELTDELLDLFRRIVSDNRHTDQWTVYHRYKTVKRFAGTLAAVCALGGEDERQRFGNDLDQASIEFAGVWAQAWFHYTQGSLDNARLLDLVERAEALADDVVSRKDLALLHLVKGRILKSMDRQDEAIAALRRSIEFRPSPDNEAFRDLAWLER
jgi:hypothetical protein